MHRISLLFVVIVVACLGWTPPILADPLRTVAVGPFGKTPDGLVSSQIRAGLCGAMEKLGLRIVDDAQDADILVKYEYKLERRGNARAVLVRAVASDRSSGILFGSAVKTSPYFPTDDKTEQAAAVRKVTRQIGDRIVSKMKSRFEHARTAGDRYFLMFVGMSLNGKAPFKVQAALKRSCDFVKLRGGDESSFFVTATCKASNEEIQVLVEQALQATYEGQKVEIESIRKSTNHLEFTLQP